MSAVLDSHFLCLSRSSIITQRQFRIEYDMPKSKEAFDYALALDEPPMYKVLLHNDDYTTMDFVVMVLKKIFHKTQEQSEQIMLDVHKKGKGMCGVYTFEIAQTKVEQVKTLAKQNEFPLLATYEEDI